MLLNFGSGAVAGNTYVGTAALGCPVERSSTALSIRTAKLRHFPKT
jgi:hypothetical protein